LKTVGSSPMLDQKEMPNGSGAVSVVCSVSFATEV